MPVPARSTEGEANGEPNGKLPETAGLTMVTNGRRPADEAGYRAYFGGGPKCWSDEGESVPNKRNKSRFVKQNN
jgi:hypothetical protein